MERVGVYVCILEVVESVLGSVLCQPQKAKHIYQVSHSLPNSSHTIFFPPLMTELHKIPEIENMLGMRN